MPAPQYFEITFRASRSGTRKHIVKSTDHETAMQRIERAYPDQDLAFDEVRFLSSRNGFTLTNLTPGSSPPEE